MLPSLGWTVDRITSLTCDLSTGGAGGSSVSGVGAAQGEDERWQVKSREKAEVVKVVVVSMTSAIETSARICTTTTTTTRSIDDHLLQAGLV